MHNDYLVLLAMFKDEGHNIYEWIDHYINQGFDKIYLMNNNSTDDWSSKFGKYSNDERVYVIDWPVTGMFAQHKGYSMMYDAFFSRALRPKYLMVCDLDEFIYARRGYKTIRHFCIDKLDDISFSSIKIPWKMFGSNGLQSHPENSVRKSFTRRMRANGDIFGKCLNKFDEIGGLDIHEAVKHKAPVLRADLKENENTCYGYYTGLTESQLDDMYLACNHYVIQSKEWFGRVKMTRGDAINNDHRRDWDYFRRYDTNELVDKEILDLT